MKRSAIGFVFIACLAGGGYVVAQQGGLPIVKDGKVVGGIGSGGSSAANDEKFVQAGLDAVK